GDLSLSLPVLTVPGRGGLDFQVSLSYSSGIRVNQQAGWVGLGWSFDPGSITRDVQVAPTQTGTDVQAVDYADLGAAIAVQPDMYQVSTPAGSFAMVRHLENGPSQTFPQSNGLHGVSSSDFFITKWRPWKIEYQTEQVGVPFQGSPNAVYRTCEYVPGSTGCQLRTDYKEFTLTDESGTRYVFAAPTISTLKAKVPDAASQSTHFYVNTWRLVAILGSDYAGTGLPSHGDPGSWVRFNYSDAVTGTPSDPAATIDPANQENESIQQIRYLTSIETPSHVAQFNVDRPATAEADEPYTTSLKLTLEGITLNRRTAGGLLPIRYVDFVYDAQRFEGVVGAPDRRGLTEIRYVARTEADGVLTANVLPGFRFGYIDPPPTAPDPEADYTDYFGFYSACHFDAFPCGGTPPEYTSPEGSYWSLETIEHAGGAVDKIYYHADAIGTTNPLDPPLSMVYHVYDRGDTNSVSNTLSFDSNVWFQGSRVHKIRRYPRGLGEASDYIEQQFEYGTGRVSGIPSMYLQESVGSRLGANGEFYTQTSRGQAAVYYPYIRTLNSDGTSQTRYFSTDLTTGVETVQTLAYRDGVATTLVTGNQDLDWGIEWATRTYGTALTLSERTYEASGTHPIAYAHHIPNLSIAINWMYQEKPLKVVQVVKPPSHPNAPFTSTDSLVTTTVYNRDLSTYLVDSQSVHAGRETDPIRTTTYFDYAHDLYAGMETAHMLQQVAKQRVETPNGDVHRSSETVWTNVLTSSGLVWKPTQEKVWKAPTPTATGRWITSSTTIYDGNANVGTVKDAYDQSVVLDYDTETETLVTSATLGTLNTSIGYDGYGRATSVTSPDGVTTVYGYDSFDRLVSQTGPDGLLMEVDYPANPYFQPYVYDAVSPDRLLTRLKRGSGLADLVSSEFFDGIGRSIQTQQTSHNGRIVQAIEYATPFATADTTRTWRPYNVSGTTHSYDTSFLSLSLAFAEEISSAGAVQTVRPIASNWGGFTHPDQSISYGYFGGEVQHEDGSTMLDFSSHAVVTDEDGNLSAEYTDRFGNTVLKRRTNLGTPITPISETATVSKDTYGGGSQGSFSMLGEEKLGDDGGISPQLENVVCDGSQVGTAYVTVPASGPHQIEYDIAFINLGGLYVGSGTVTQYRGGPGQDGLITHVTSSDGSKEGTFIGYPGEQYNIKLSACAGGDSPGRITVTGTITITAEIDFLDTTFDYDALDQLVSVKQPNANKLNPATGWETTYSFNTLGQQVEKTSADMDDPVKSRYDDAGRIRATLNDTLVFYTKYDVYGRVIESGRIGTPAFGEGTAEAFFNNAPVHTDLSWPSSSVPREEVVYYTYNSTKALLDEAVYEIDWQDDVWGRQQYVYDTSARLEHVDVCNEGTYDGTTFSCTGLEKRIAYAYDRQGALLERHVEAIGSDGTKLYTWNDYDAAGRMSALRTNGEINIKLGSATTWEAQYVYDGIGRLETLRLGCGTGGTCSPAQEV
ncbi:MAG: SpvB/TcaC N-terminal domain-containing protein, partial [Bacteroidota bacterium]